jgi:predicted transcriptional regulator
MSIAEKLAKAIRSAQGDVDYWRDIAITDFTRELHQRKNALRISQGELARRMGTSRPYITKMLEGSNFTLQTMVKLAMALDAVVRIRLEGRGERERARRIAEARQQPCVAKIIDISGKRSIKTLVASEGQLDTGNVRASWG